MQMRNWIKRKVINWLQDDSNQKVMVSVAVRETERPEQRPILNFRVYSAVNGQILEFSKYDQKNDQHTSTIYIIEKDKEIGDYVAKCVSMELLK